MGIRKTTFFEMKARIQERMPELKVIALYNGQPEEAKLGEYEQSPFLTPAVFIQLTGGQSIHTNNLVREYPEYLFRLHYVTEIFQDDFSATEQEDSALDHLDEFEKLINAIDQWGGATYVSNFRVFEEIMDDAKSHIVHHIAELYGRLQDCGLAELEQGQTTTAESIEIVRLGQSDFDQIKENLPNIQSDYR